MNILVLCTGNSCRSQMAEGFLRHFSIGKHKVESAGIEAHGLNPIAVKVMAEVNIDISQHESKTIDDLNSDSFDIVLTVCDSAQENCPYFPSKIKLVHKSFPDPAGASGSEEEVLTVFRSVREEIKEFSKSFIAEIEAL